MNRTERLYALVEELRAVAPRPRSAAWLAARFEVSARTIERDLDALRESGVPIWAEAGRRGGYTLDRTRTLPPLTLTAGEALAIGVALRAVAGSPFADTARSATQKVLAALPADVREREAALAARVHRLPDDAGDHAAVGRRLQEALADGRVLHLSYVDAEGAHTERDVEPLGWVWSARGWCLLAWCRLRADVRGFVVERIAEAAVLDETAPMREVDAAHELARLQAEPLRT